MVSRNYVDEKALEATAIRESVDFYLEPRRVSEIRGYDDFRQKNSVLDMIVAHQRLVLRNKMTEDSRGSKGARRDVVYHARNAAIKIFQEEVAPLYQDLFDKFGLKLNC